MSRELLIIFIGLFGISSAIVCHPSFCNSVKCSGMIKEVCEFEGKDFRPRSTMCGCCDRCINYLDIGDECGIETDLNFLIGGPPHLQQRCKPGLDCVHNVCQQSE